jgi:hypothetical protein
MILLRHKSSITLALLKHLRYQKALHLLQLSAGVLVVVQVITVRAVVLVDMLKVTWLLLRARL